MAPDGATSRSTQHAVLASNVTRNAAYCRTFQTTFGLGSLGKDGKATHQRDSNKCSFHKFFQEWIVRFMVTTHPTSNTLKWFSQR